MATLNAKVYGHGAALTTSYAAIYTVPASTQGWVPVVELKNSDSATRTVYIQINSNGSDVDYCQFDIPTLGSAKVTCMDLETGDIIKAKASVTSVVYYWVGVGEYA